MDLTEKEKALDLLPLTPDLVKYICEFDRSWFDFGLESFSYAKFHKGHVILYTKAYIDSKTIEEFEEDFKNFISFCS